MGIKFFYYLFLLPVSRLPFWLLYLISDFIYLILYRIIGYRKKVVRTNLQLSFPEKEMNEIRSIEKKFYSHLCDLIVESIKAFTISSEEAQKRMVNRNVSLINRFYKENKHVVMVGGHYGNWELYAITIGLGLEHEALALYTSLTNKFMDEKVRTSRSKYGLGMYSSVKIRNLIKANEKNLYAVIFAADQSPRKKQRSFWLKFLNQETGVQFGTEKFAINHNAAVVFGNIYKVKRGYYEVEYELICEDATNTEYGFITKNHTERLEKIIQENPEYWLWSHKRWKHQRPEGEILH